MKFDEITQRQNALIKDHCVSCNQPLPPGAVFCEHCGPPILPDAIHESGMSIGETFKKIALLTLVFAAIVAYKTEWDYRTLFDNTGPATTEEQAQEIPQDKDYELIHYVNVSFANIREEPSGQAKIIGGAGKGEHLIVLEKGEHWTQVDLGGQKGWIATHLLSTAIE